MLVVCEICGAEIDEDATICPVCGHENILREDKVKGLSAIILISVVIFFIILIAEKYLY